MLIKKIIYVILITGLLAVVAFVGFFSGINLALANQNGDVLTIVLRDSHGTPIQNARTELLSYDWQVPVGQPYKALAEGLTNTAGEISFFVGNYPRSGYRFRFSKTEKTLPADIFFESQENNQYRGYPAAVIGGRAEKKYFVMASGLAYNDLSAGQGLPNWEKNPVGGLDKPRLTVMPAEAYLSTVIAGTAEARAAGQPNPTRPPRPAQVTPGMQAALSAPAPVTSSTGQESRTQIPVTNRPTYPPVDNGEPFPPFLIILAVAVAGLTALVLVLFFRKRIIEALDPRTQQLKKRNRNRK